MTPSETQANPTVALQQQLVVAVPATGKCFAMPDSEWEHLRSQVNKVQPPKIVFLSLASILFGVSGSAGISALTIAGQLLDDPNAIQTRCYELAGICLVLGIGFLVFHRMQRSALVYTKEHVLEEMTRIENHYKPK